MSPQNNIEELTQQLAEMVNLNNCLTEKNNDLKRQLAEKDKLLVIRDKIIIRLKLQLSQSVKKEDIEKEVLQKDWRNVINNLHKLLSSQSEKEVKK